MSDSGLPNNKNTFTTMNAQTHPDLSRAIELVDTLLFETTPTEFSHLHHKSGVTECSVETLSCDIGALALFSTHMVLTHEKSKPYGEFYLVEVQKGVQMAQGQTLISTNEYVIEVLPKDQFLGTVFETDIESVPNRVRTRSMTKDDLSQLVMELTFTLDFHGAAQADTDRINALDDTLE
jgi:hypothetical protein